MFQGRPPLGDKSGFTLLETLFAITIMVITFAAILMVQSASINASARAKQMGVVAMLSKNIMLETEQLMKEKAFGDLPEEEDGNFPEPYQEYAWSRTVKEVEFPNLSLTGGSPSPEGKQDAEMNNQEEMIGKLVTGFLSKALKRITVTVTWKKGKGTQSFSLNTYWVNLNNDFSLTQ